MRIKWLLATAHSNAPLTLIFNTNTMCGSQQNTAQLPPVLVTRDDIRHQILSPRVIGGSRKTLDPCVYIDWKVALFCGH